MQMIDGGSRAFGADDVAGVFYAGKRIRKLRFLMTDNTLATFWVRMKSLNLKVTAQKG